MKGIEVDGKGIAINENEFSSNEFAFIDSGTTFTYLKSNIYKYFKNYLNLILVQ